MVLSRPVKLSPASEMTLTIFSFGLTNISDREASWLRVGYSEISGVFSDTDAFEVITWLSGPALGADPVIGLGGVTGYVPDPNPRVSFPPAADTIVQVPSDDEYTLAYAQWRGPAYLRLELTDGGGLRCTWAGADGHLVMSDDVPAARSDPWNLGYATIDAIVGVGPNTQTPGIYLGEWKVTGDPPAPVPYPFGSELGGLAIGAGSAGMIRVT